MSALIYTQLGVSPYTQKQTGFAGYPSLTSLILLPTKRVETAALQAL